MTFRTNISALSIGGTSGINIVGRDADKLESAVTQLSELSDGFHLGYGRWCYGWPELIRNNCGGETSSP